MELGNEQMDPANAFVENERRNAVGNVESVEKNPKISANFFKKTDRKKIFGQKYHCRPVN